ncbi:MULTISPECIES: DNA-directed RNA polymerase subunit delta [unclassified Planococcus (in: firmicutes)]|uniref:DNA-directed RNA polymerase subunit delta n=1 Tax=unclassified Planococcus (in: firmicutes) TaxID=2662419 RepID=UPI000C32D110|nr:MULTISPECIES: DNA-directed RNA polymerase subunit delta [unclassified Planococcus (in: firmicutes)]AUD14623.1 DNA-directed RNA polymerase subunit delta [Planococcus sp. MB-3u-03]PKG44926.1 DNA-directed RNA polymerase subunit delta [Planococcus sp. Urea-trap-24]PKG87269.1 DNA-directed RNA polymerase subunit delta [Planococcus sp. Urea-3u-39]PKH42394.1 DNA-directed RNA polymerase subunit delta [Planococcus sp. MB-3u-09]
MNIRELTKEELLEESFVDLTYAILEETKETKTFSELVAELQQLIGLSEEEMKARLAQYYTDMNIDGRFLILGENRWGLREWYPVEQIEEESAPTVKARKKKKSKSTDDDFDDMDLELEDELDFEDFGEDDGDVSSDDDDDDEVAVKAPVVDLDFDSTDDDDDVDEVEDVGVLVEDLDGNIIDEEEDDEEEEEEDGLK